MLVVSPLIALMVDQVTSLRKRSVNCSARVKSIESTLLLLCTARVRHPSNPAHSYTSRQNIDV